MDQGPFRMPRRPSSATGSERRAQPVPAQSAEPTAEPVSGPTAVEPTAKPKKSASRWPIIVVAILILAGLGLGLFTWLQRDQTVGNFIDHSTYQAVFSANGQVYFGKLDAASGAELRLTDVYYVQSSTTGDDSGDGSASNDLELIKLGSNEVYGPRDEMVFIKDQVLYYENLDPDGKVSNLIRSNQDN